MEPIQYIKYLKMQPRKSSFCQGDSLSDNQYDWSEILYEKINTDFWIFSLETEEKLDTCYVYTPKNSKKQYFSINYYEAQSSFGYQLDENITFDKNLTIFSGPSATYKIYLRKKSRLKCYRLVFSGRYLRKLLNFAASNAALYETSQIILTGKGNMIRPTHEIEKMALQKLHYLLKYTRSSFNYNLSLTTNAFGITDHFFKNSSLVPASVHSIQSDAELMARIVNQLESQIRSKFPGIEALAADFYISTTKLKVSFRKTFATTPLVYFRKLQMMYAQEVLQTKQITVKELAMELGFKKPSTFSVWFKRYTGKFPHEI
jgi:AraC-like DNA-binding protein